MGDQQGGATDGTHGPYDNAGLAGSEATDAAAGPAVSAAASQPQGQPQGQPLSQPAGALPQTGLASELLPLGGAGFAILMVGLLLVLGSRRATGSASRRGVLGLG